MRFGLLLLLPLLTGCLATSSTIRERDADSSDERLTPTALNEFLAHPSRSASVILTDGTRSRVSAFVRVSADSVVWSDDYLHAPPQRPRVLAADSLQARPHYEIVAVELRDGRRAWRRAFAIGFGVGAASVTTAGLIDGEEAWVVGLIAVGFGGVFGLVNAFAAWDNAAAHVTRYVFTDVPP